MIFFISLLSSTKYFFFLWGHSKEFDERQEAIDDMLDYIDAWKFEDRWLRLALLGGMMIIVPVLAINTE